MTKAIVDEYTEDAGETVEPVEIRYDPERFTSRITVAGDKPHPVEMLTGSFGCPTERTAID